MFNQLSLIILILLKLILNNPQAIEWVSQDKYFAFQKCVHMVDNSVVVGTLEIPLNKLAEVSEFSCGNVGLSRVKLHPVL